MGKRLKPLCLGLATLLALFCAGCQSTPAPLPESGAMELAPVSVNDPRFSSFELFGQSVRPDGAWVFTHLTRMEPGAERPSGSISVLTDVNGQNYYELPGLQGEAIDDAAWAPNGALVLYSQAWKKAMFVALDENADGPPRLTLQVASNARRAPVDSGYRLPLDARAPAAPYNQDQPQLPFSDR